MSTRPNRHSKGQQTAAPLAPETLPIEPLPPTAARRAEEDARQRPLTVSQEVIDNRRHGRIEVETKRVSEEMTRLAQERLRASQATSTPTNTLPSPHAAAASATSPERGAVMASQPATLPVPTPLKRVIVPLDGTTYSERALPYVAPIARMTGADITLLHVITEPTLPVLDVVSRSVDRLLSEAPRANLDDPTGYLVNVQAQLAQHAVEAESLCISAPSTVDGIEMVMARLDANLIILATHARYGVQQQLLGSVGDRLIQQGRTPVLLIPPHVNVPAYPSLTLSRVLVPLDGSMLAEQALAPVISIARHAASRENMHLHIVLFYVADNNISRRDGVRYVEGMRERLRAQGLPASVEITSAAVVGSPPGAIVGAAEHGIINLPDYPAPFDLVTMATHGRGGLQRWLYGSVAAYVLPRITTPVLLVHPQMSELSDM